MLKIGMNSFLYVITFGSLIEYIPLQTSSTAIGYSFCTLIIPLIVNIIIAFWIYKDAKKRNKSGAWGILGFFLSIIGLIIWLVVRPDMSEVRQEEDDRRSWQRSTGVAKSQQMSGTTSTNTQQQNQRPSSTMNQQSQGSFSSAPTDNQQQVQQGLERYGEQIQSPQTASTNQQNRPRSNQQGSTQKPPPPPPPDEMNRSSSSMDEKEKTEMTSAEIKQSISELKKEEEMIDTRAIETALEEGSVKKAEKALVKLEENYQEYRNTIEQLESVDEKLSNLAEKLASGEIDNKSYKSAKEDLENKKYNLEEKLNELRQEVIYEDYEKPF